QQARLGFQYGGLGRAGVEADDVQQHLYVGLELGAARRQYGTLAVQAPGQLAQQQLVNVGGQTAGPAGIIGGQQAAVVLPLQQGFALQVVGHCDRAEQHGQTLALGGDGGIAVVQLVQRYRRVRRAAGQAKQAGQQQYGG